MENRVLLRFFQLRLEVLTAEEDPVTMSIAVPVKSEGPYASVGRFLRQRRVAKGKKAIEVAEAAGLAQNTITNMEQGWNTDLESLHAYAEALSYRNVIELFKASDDQTLALLRLWHGLGDDEFGQKARKDVLREIRRYRDVLEKGSAT